MSAKPILKWAGGKSKLTEAIHNRMHERFKSGGYNYVEPFFGGGAIFFWLKNIMKFQARSSPMQNGFVESFNGSFEDECLNETLFSSLTETRHHITLWKADYNAIRPHSSPGNLTPREYAQNQKLATQGLMRPRQSNDSTGKW